MKIKLIHCASVAFIVSACSAPHTKQAPSEAREMNVVGSEVTYATDSTTMKGYIALDENDRSKRPGILVVHEWWGHNDYARERADKLAALGYVALAVDMYGEGKLAEHPQDAGAFASEVMGNIDEAKARFESAMETLRDNPLVDSEKIAAIGYCFGGSVVLSMANAGYDLDAVAAFHTGLGLPIMPDSGVVVARVFVANGADDPFISAQQIADFKAMMDASGVDYKYVAYDGAVHSFTSQQADELGEKFELPLAYNDEADSASWEEMKVLFEEVF